MSKKHVTNTQSIPFPEDIQPLVAASGGILSLCRIRGGDLVMELSEDLENLVQTCMATGKKGHLALKLTVKPTGIGKCRITDDLVAKPPKPDKGDTSMFATPRGQLLTHSDGLRALLLGLRCVEVKRLRALAQTALPLPVWGLPVTRYESLLLAFLPPVRLDFLDKQHALAFGVGAFVDPNMGKDVGLIPVGRGVSAPLVSVLRRSGVASVIL